MNFYIAVSGAVIATTCALMVTECLGRDTDAKRPSGGRVTMTEVTRVVNGNAEVIDLCKTGIREIAGSNGDSLKVSGSIQDISQDTTVKGCDGSRGHSGRSLTVTGKITAGKDGILIKGGDAK